MLLFNQAPATQMNHTCALGALHYHLLSFDEWPCVFENDNFRHSTCNPAPSQEITDSSVSLLAAGLAVRVISYILSCVWDVTGLLESRPGNPRSHSPPSCTSCLDCSWLMPLDFFLLWVVLSYYSPLSLHHIQVQGCVLSVASCFFSLYDPVMDVCISVFVFFLFFPLFFWFCSLLLIDLCMFFSCFAFSVLCVCLPSPFISCRETVDCSKLSGGAGYGWSHELQRAP